MFGYSYPEEGVSVFGASLFNFTLKCVGVHKRCVFLFSLQRLMPHIAISCKTCSWRRGADIQPTQCPPECEVCGFRQGSDPDFMRKKKLPAGSRRKKDRPRGTKRDNYAFDVEPRKK